MDSARAVLLIHDMQRYFPRPFAPELAEPLTKNVVALREYCRATGMPAVHTASAAGCPLWADGC